MRWLWLIPLLFIGCDNAPWQQFDFTPVIAAEIGLASTEVTPVDVPKPAPGQCQNCRGTGKVGDGTVMVDCAVCGGDGRIEAEERPTAGTTENKPGPSKNTEENSDSTAKSETAARAQAPDATFARLAALESEVQSLQARLCKCEQPQAKPVANAAPTGGSCQRVWVSHKSAAQTPRVQYNARPQRRGWFNRR